MDRAKEVFYETSAKRLAGSTLLYGVDSVVHVEDKDDILFWQQLLSKYRPGRYKFMPATSNEKGNRSTGCTQCLKYKKYLSQRFFICIDSDMRYLLDEEGISAQNGILQTYTYSWENHYAFASKLQQAFETHTHKGADFDFVAFLLHYSEIVYEPFLLVLYQERNGLADFRRDEFRKLISLQYVSGDGINNGEHFLDRLASALQEATADVRNKCDFNLTDESERYALKGLKKENAYLYVRGHCLYNSLVSIGRKLCEGTKVDFEQNILKEALAFEQYDAISRIKTDIGILKTIRKTYKGNE